jgi:hypothetical protein
MLEVSEVIVQRLKIDRPKRQVFQHIFRSVTSGPHLGNNASMAVPFGGDRNDERVEFPGATQS